MAAVIAEHSAYVQSAEKMIVAVEDEWNIWPLISSGFEARLPIRSALLTNKNRQTVEVRGLPIEFLLTTDPKLVNRPAVKNSPHWFRHPYATLILVSCEDAEDYRLNVRPKLQLLVRGEWREWLIVHVVKISSNEAVNRAVKKISTRIEDHFRKERVCRLELDGLPNPTWQEVESKIVECIRITLETRMTHYGEEVSRLNRARFSPNSNFSAFFIDKESLAFMFEMAQLREEALNEYEELERIFLEIIKFPASKFQEFGGKDEGDEKSSILDYKRKPFSSFSQAENLKQFDFHQYLFARQAQLLLSLDKIVDLAQRGYKFIQYISKEIQKRQSELPFGFQEVWVFTSCVSLAKLCGDKYVSSSINNHFYSILASLYAYARSKLMRIMVYIGHEKLLSNSPCNSSALNLSPWPDLLAWPSLPLNSEEKIKNKEQLVQELLEHFQKKGIDGVVKSSPFLFSLLEFMNKSNLNSRDSDTSETSSTINPDSAIEDPLDSFQKNMRKLSEKYAAAEISLEKRVICTELEGPLLSSVLLEELYEDVTRAAAGNYLRSKWHRHGAALDAELAHSYIQRGDYRGAIHQYEKLCAIYLTERWHSLAAHTLRLLLDCQMALADVAAIQSTRVRLLSLENGHLSQSERAAIQQDLLDLARKNPTEAILLDISSLLSFSMMNNEVMEMGEGDSDTLKIFVWSNFPEAIEFDMLTLTLVAAPHFNAEEGIKVKTERPVLLNPQRNEIFLSVKAQRSGVYVLSSLTGHVLQLHLRSTHVSVKAKSPEAEEHLSFERLLKPALKVSPPRHLVDASVIVNEGLLVNAFQWLGLKISPIHYSLQNACLHISSTPVLTIPDPQWIEIEIIPSEVHDQSESAPHNSLHRNPSIPLSSSRNSSSTSSPSTSPYLSPKSANPPIPDQSPTSPFFSQIDSFLLPSPLSPHFHETPFSRSSTSLTSSSLPAKFMAQLKGGKIDFPDTVMDKTCIVWIRIFATKEKEETSVVPFPSSPRSPFLLSPQKSLSPSTSLSSSLRENLKVKSRPNGVAQEERSLGSHGSFTSRIDMVEKSHDPEKNLDCLCTMHLKLEFGPSRSRLYEKAISLHFTEAFHVMTRVISRSIDGELLLQITFQSRIFSNLRILKAKLQLQEGLDFLSEKVKQKPKLDNGKVGDTESRDDYNGVYEGEKNNTGDSDDDLSSWILPLTLSPMSEFSLLYNFIPSKSKSDSMSTPLKSKILNSDASEFSKQSTVLVDYIIEGDRMTGAHTPARPILKQFEKDLTMELLRSDSQEKSSNFMDRESENATMVESSDPVITCTFSHSFIVQLPTTQRKLAVGILPMPDMTPKVGSLISLTWQIERLVDEKWDTTLALNFHHNSEIAESTFIEDSITNKDEMVQEIFYEVKTLPEQWMIAGRKKGFIKLPLNKGARALVQLTCIPISSGFLNPPSLILPMIERSYISNMPAGPRLICILPSDPCYCFCATKHV